MVRDRRPKSTSLPLTTETKVLLANLKLSDGEESWDHLLQRLYRVARGAAERGILNELSEAGRGIPVLPPSAPRLEA